MSEKQSALELMLAQYENSSKPRTEQSEKFDMKNYFTIYLPEGKKSDEKVIRLLPNGDGTPFVEMWAHTIGKGKDKKTLACLKHEENKACPFCEANDELRSTGDANDKETAKKYSARKYYVVKLIDRSDEEHGPKFWRFKHDYTNDGVFDKFMSLIKGLKTDISHAETGRDVKVMIGKDQNGYTIVQSILHLDPAPVSLDAAQKEAWLSNDKTWRSVYSVKTYDYLEIIVKGGIPVFDKDNKCYVDKASLESNGGDKTEGEVTMGIENIKNNIVPQLEMANDSSDDSDDDLPF